MPITASKRLVVVFALAGLLFTPAAALAHEEVPVGKYLLEVGWLSEPPLLGQPNAVFLSVTDGETGAPVEGLNTLHTLVATGGQTRRLELRPLGEDAPGQYAADFIPTARGAYTVKLAGKIEAQDVDVSVDIEEVEPASDYQFPAVLPSLPEVSQQLANLQAENQALQSALALNRWLALGGLALGLAGSALGIVSLRRKRIG